MSQKNYCADGGYLVDAKGPLPLDKTEFSTPGTPYIQGCNSIRCRRCGVYARSEPHFFPLTTSDNAKEIYETADWRTLPYMEYMMKGRENTRAYCCQCTVTFTADARQLGKEDDPRVPWSWFCDGHPVATLPIQMGELSIAADTDFGTLVQRAFSGWQPAGVDADSEGRPGMWIQDLYERLVGTEAEPPLIRGVAAQLASPDPRMVSQALRFFLVFGEADKDNRLLDMACLPAERERLRVPDPFRGNHKTLEDKLMYALSKQLRDNAYMPVLRPLLRDYALVEGRVMPVLDALVHEDYEWTSEHVVELAGKEPENIRDFLVIAFSTLGREETRAIAKLPQLDPKVLRECTPFLYGDAGPGMREGLEEREAEMDPQAANRARMKMKLKELADRLPAESGKKD